VAQRNASQANSMLQVADGAVGTVASILDRMKELASQANSANVGSQTDKLDAEFQELKSELTRIANTTVYNGTKLVDGTFGVTVDAASTAATDPGIAKINVAGAGADTFTFDTGTADSITLTRSSDGSTQTVDVTGLGAGATINFNLFGVSVVTSNAYAAQDDIADGATIVTTATTAANFMVSSSGNYASTTGDLVAIDAAKMNLTSTGLGVNTLDLSNVTNAQAALVAIDSAIDKVADAIGAVGAAQSRIDFASTNAANLVENTQAAESTIRDADMAYEMTVFTKNQILQQAGTAMLAQANQAPQSVLKLLQ
jgi:flagellin